MTLNRVSSSPIRESISDDVVGRAADSHDVGALRAGFAPGAVIDATAGPSNLGQWLETMAAPPRHPTSMDMLGTRS